MDDDDIVWEKASRLGDRFKMVPPGPPKIDKQVSEIVGKDILINDPRLLKLVVKWKKETGETDEVINYLSHEKYIEELKETFQ